MIDVKLEATPRRFEIECLGHATGAPEVCAAVSALLQSLHSWLLESGAELPLCRMAPGNCLLVFSGAGCAAVYRLVRLGLLRLQAAAPAALRVAERGAMELAQFGEAGAEPSVGAHPQMRPQEAAARADEGIRPYEAGAEPSVGAHPQMRPSEAGAEPSAGAHPRMRPSEAADTRADEGIRPSEAGAEPSVGAHPQMRSSEAGAEPSVGAHPRMRPSEAADARADEGIRPSEAGAEPPDPAAEAAARTLARWAAEAEALRARLPGFDLAEAAAEPRFRALLRGGFGVEEAFGMAHLEELVRAAARLAAARAEQRLAADIRARGGRPAENGVLAHSGFALREDAARRSRAGRADIARRVARGETVTF